MLTVHRSKGLEFPIVYYPYLWEPGFIPSGLPVAFHDPDAGDVRTIDVGLEGPDFDRHKQQHLVEQRGEDLRLAYVALTRAQHQAVVWWAGSWNSRDSALGRLLFARDDDGHRRRRSAAATPTDAAATARFEALARRRRRAASASSGPRSACRSSWTGTPARARPSCPPRASTASSTGAGGALRSATSPRACTRRGSPASRRRPLLTDEPATRRPPGRAGGRRRALRATPSLLAAMPVGATSARSCTACSRRPTSPRRTSTPSLRRGWRRCWPGARSTIGDPAAAVAGLRAAIETPLGAVSGCATSSAADRLDELDFEFPLVGGDEPTAQLLVDAIADVLRDHLPPGDPLAGYADRLGDPVLRRSVRGYVTGSIDLVLRRRRALRRRRLQVELARRRRRGADRLALPPGRARGLEMERGHYGLQALLYTVALHRYLRWRLPDYDAERNLGGVLYLFLRGMTGAEMPVVDGRPCGVFAWQPAKALVEALSDVLDRGGAAA